MKLTGACLQIATSLALAATCMAQGRGTRPAKREPPPKRVKQVVVIAPPENPPPETREVGRAIVTYSPRSNKTSVLVSLRKVYRRGNVSADLEFSTGFDGRELVRQGPLQGKVQWSFVSEWDIFESGVPLHVTADGERYSFEALGDFNLPGMYVGSMDFASFERIANSKSARLSVGRIAFDLTEAQHVAMRDMLKVFETPAMP